MSYYRIESVNGMLVMGAGYPIMSQTLMVTPPGANLSYRVIRPKVSGQLYPIQGIKEFFDPVLTEAGEYAYCFTLSDPVLPKDPLKLEYGIIYEQDSEQPLLNPFIFPCKVRIKRVNLEVLFPVEHQPTLAYGGAWTDTSYCDPAIPIQRLAPKSRGDSAFASVRLIVKEPPVGSLVGIGW